MPLKAPKADPIVESLKREALNQLICFSLDQLDYVSTTRVRHYNTRQPPRGIGMNNEVLDETYRPGPTAKSDADRNSRG